MIVSLNAFIPNIWARPHFPLRSVDLANGAATCSPFTSQVMEDDASVLVGTYSRVPVVLARGKGCKVYDYEGNEYLDMGAGIAVNALGHGDPDWVRAVVEQANLLTHTSNTYYTVPQVELAKRLVDCSFADRVFFVNSGTEANEAAIKFSRKFQRCAHPDEVRTGFVSFTNSFHGRTMGALALTSKDHYRTPFEPVMPGVVFLEYGDTEGVTELIRSSGSGIAAVFVEPVQGEGGIHSVTQDFIRTLRDCCNDAGVLLVFDEVQCGLGRTGHLWAHEMYCGVKPDMMTLAKPLAGGLPIGAVLLTERVAASIARGDHGSTFAGGPLVCEAAIAVLKKISDPHFLSDVVAKGHHLRQLLSCELGGHRHVKEIRGHGMMFGVELDVPAAPFVDACRRSGLLVLTAGKGNVIRLTPPLVISKEELHRAVSIMSNCLKLLE